MGLTATDVERSVQPAVCLYVRQTGELCKNGWCRLGLQTRESLSNPVLDKGPDRPNGTVTFKGSMHLALVARWTRPFLAVGRHAAAMQPIAKLLCPLVGIYLALSKTCLFAYL